MLLNNRDLAFTCTLLGFAGTLLCLVYVYTTRYFSQGNAYTRHIPVCFAMLLLFGIGMLLLKYLLGSDDTSERINQRSRRLFIQGYAVVLLAADWALALLAQTTGGGFLFLYWYVVTVITLPFFHVISPLVHVLLLLALQAAGVLVLWQLAGEQFVYWAICGLTASTAVILTIYILCARLHTDITRQLTNTETIQEAYVDIQLKLQQNNAQLRKTVHDLRNPVASAQLFAEFLLKYTANSNKELAANLESILECCKQMNDTLNVSQHTPQK